MTLGETQEIVRLYEQKIARLTQWVYDLQSGMYVNCVYCGHRYGPGETTPVSMADALKAHIEQCQEHPMSALRAALLDLYNGTAEYIYLNNLGDPHNTTPMRRASEVLGVAYPRSLKQRALP